VPVHHRDLWDQKLHVLFFPETVHRRLQMSAQDVPRQAQVRGSRAKTLLVRDL
jgi:hypothetical protein